jgi:MYXO-CTERM domain-containing protein
VPRGGARCVDDDTASEAADKTKKLCGPFKCDPSTGNCFPICTDSNACAPNYACNLATKACEAAVSTEEDGGGCSVARRPADRTAGRTALALLAAVVASALGRRRRARPAREQGAES